MTPKIVNVQGVKTPPNIPNFAPSVTRAALPEGFSSVGVIEDESPEALSFIGKRVEMTVKLGCGY